jgi:Fe-S cluster assembly iron-binding protein IscA
MITVTESAKKQLDEILMDDVSMKYVRAFISGGGCSGFNYGFTLEADKEEDDFVIENLVVDAVCHIKPKCKINMRLWKFV